MQNSPKRENDSPKQASTSRALSDLERQRLFNQLRQHVQPANRTLRSGYTTLDEQLGGGWPQGCLIEIMGSHSLLPLLPLLKTISNSQRHIVWIKPPFIPYPPALAQQGIRPASQLLIEPESPNDTFWSMEQLLRTAQCGIVLGWGEPNQPHTLRRLQLAAEAGDSIAVLFRSAAAQRQNSAAAVRLLLQQRPACLHGRLLKVRGQLPGKSVQFHQADNQSAQPHG